METPSGNSVWQLTSGLVPELGASCYIQGGVCSDKTMFDRARNYLSTKMTAEEMERYCEAVRKEHPRVLEAYGTGLLFLKNCDFLSMERFITESWKQCSSQELLDAGICTGCSTVDAIVMDGSKSVRFGEGGTYYPATVSA